MSRKLEQCGFGRHNRTPLLGQYGNTLSKESFGSPTLKKLPTRDRWHYGALLGDVISQLHSLTWC